MITKLKLKRSAGNSPLLSTMFNIDPLIMGLKFSNSECKMYSNPRTGYQFELGFNLVNLEKECLIECDYNSDLFHPDTVNKYINYYINILKDLTTDPEIPLRKIQLLTNSEINDILNTLNNSECN